LPDKGEVVSSISIGLNIFFFIFSFFTFFLHFNKYKKKFTKTQPLPFQCLKKTFTNTQRLLSNEKSAEAVLLPLLLTEQK